MFIRPCELLDIPAITAIYSEAVMNGVATFEVEPPSESEMIHRREKLLTNGYPYLVAEDEGTVIGYAYAGGYHERAAFRSTVEDSIYIHPGYQGCGVGKALLTQLIKEATQRNFRQMVAVIGDSDNLGSIKLHESLGFILVGTLRSVGWKHGRWLDTVTMQLPLGEADTSAYKL